MASLPMMPGMGGGMMATAPAASAPPANLSTLMGPQQAPAQAPPANADEQARAVMGQVRDLISGVESLARQYPAAAEDLDVVKQQLAKAMVKIVQQNSGNEAAGPAVIG